MTRRSQARRVGLGAFGVPVLIVIAAACGGPAKYVALRAGECLPASANVVGTREPDPPTVSGASGHRYEVYGLGRLKGTATFPGAATVEAASRQVCYALFESGVGIAAGAMPPTMKVVYLSPTESSWNDERDRDVECLLVFDKDRTGRFAKPQNRTDQ